MTSEDEWLRSGRVRAPPTEMTRELRDDSEAWHDSEPREGASALNANSWSGIGAIPKQGGGNHEDFQTAAKLLGISGEVLANFLSAPKHEGQKTDQFFPAVESQDPLKFCLFVRGFKSLLIHNSVFSETNLHFIVFFN